MASARALALRSQDASSIEPIGQTAIQVGGFGGLLTSVTSAAEGTQYLSVSRRASGLPDVIFSVAGGVMPQSIFTFSDASLTALFVRGAAIAAH